VNLCGFHKSQSVDLIKLVVRDALRYWRRPWWRTRTVPRKFAIGGL